MLNVAPRVGSTRPILVNTEILRITQLIDRAQQPSTDVKSVAWGPDGRWVYAVVPTSALLSGTALNNSQGETVLFISSFDSLFAYEVNGTKHPMPHSQANLSAAVRVIPTDSPSDQGGAIGGGKYDGNLVWIP